MKTGYNVIPSIVAMILRARPRKDWNLMSIRKLWVMWLIGNNYNLTTSLRVSEKGYATFPWGGLINGK